MYYVITEAGVISGRSKKTVQHKLKGDIDDSQFKSIGSDKVAKLTDKDIDFIKDVSILESIPIQRLFKPDNKAFLLQVAVLIITLIILISK